jgi:hypothetical protein
MADTPSSIDQLLKLRSEIGKEREPKLFDLPVYGSALQAKYRVLSREERKDAQKQVFRMAQAGEDRVVERGYSITLTRACIGIYTDGVPVEKAWDLGDEPVIWGDDRLAGQLGMDKPSPRAREVIEFVFNDDDDALEAHHNEVTRWMEQSWETDDADF